MNRNNINIIIAVSLVVLAATGRVVNASLHLPNFLPIAAIGMFSGVLLKDKRALAFLIPLLGQFLADVYFQLFTNVPGFYAASSQLFNYGAIIAATSLGVFMKNMKAVRIFGHLVGASVVFFVVSNFGYFAEGWNGYSFAGFTKTYVDALLFYKNSFAADMVGGALLFGGYFLVEKALINKAQKVKA